MRYLLTISCVFIFAVYSCTKNNTPKNCPTTCGSVGATAYFSGYSVEDIDTVIVKTYRQGSAFGTLEKTDTIRKTDSINVQGSKGGRGSIYVQPRTDYTIYIPATAQTFSLSVSYSSRVDTFPCDRGRTCQEPFAGASVTGGAHDYQATGPSSAFIELKKQ